MEGSTRKKRSKKRTFSKRKRQRKSWLQRRTENYESVRAIVDSGLADECAGVGSVDSEMPLRIGRKLGSGAFGSVHDMHMYAGDVVIHLAVKLLMNDDTSLEPEEVETNERYIADVLSRAVLEGRTEHFLLYYGYEECDMPTSEYPKDFNLMDIERAIQLQRWMDTLLAYLGGPPELLQALRESDLRAILFSTDPPIRKVAGILKADHDREFKRRLESRLRLLTAGDVDPVELAPVPTAIPVRMLIMEKASMTLDEYIKGCTLREAHAVVRQIISASDDFVRITSMVHMDLFHMRNMMVIQHDDETKLVLIDFGRANPLGDKTPLEGVLSMVDDATTAVRNWLYHNKDIHPELLETIDGFPISPISVDHLYVLWDILAEKNVKEKEEALPTTEGIQEKLGSLYF
jgi:hypothetical protein